MEEEISSDSEQNEDNQESFNNEGDFSDGNENLEDGIEDSLEAEMQDTVSEDPFKEESNFKTEPSFKTFKTEPSFKTEPKTELLEVDEEFLPEENSNSHR